MRKDDGGMKRMMMQQQGSSQPTPHSVRLDLRKVINHPGYNVVLDFETDVELWDDSNQWVSVRGKAVGTNVDGRYVLVTGKAWGVITLECSRCLTEFDQELEASFEAQCDIVNFHMMAEGLPIKDGEEITAIFDANSADLLELTRQGLLVSLSMRPLCHPDCKGLCPYCGANLNKEHCDCRPPEDPRWAGLDVLMKRLKP